MVELQASIWNEAVAKNLISNGVIPEYLTQIVLPKIIQKKYPDFTPEEVDYSSSMVALSMAYGESDVSENADGRKFIKIANQFVEVDRIPINLIDKINPFQRAYEVLSKAITPDVLKTIEYVIEEQRSDISEEEAILLCHSYLPKYQADHGGAIPSINDPDPLNKRIAQAIAHIQNRIRRGEIKM